MESSNIPTALLLPRETHYIIAAHLDPASLCNLRSVNKYFHELLTDQLFWKKKYKLALQSVSRFIVDENKSVDSNWRLLYLLIMKYKCLFGYWQMCTGDPCGKIIKFEFSEQSSTIIGSCSDKNNDGVSFVPHVHIGVNGTFSAESLKPFAIELSCGGSVVNSCCEIFPQEEHSQYVDKVLYTEKRLKTIQTTGSQDGADSGQVFSEWVKLKSFSISIPSSTIIAPGVFTTIYDIHGYELVHVTFYQDMIVGSKITGDENVPYGKHSFIAYTSRSLQLTYAEQETVESCFSEEDRPVTAGDGHPQPFRVPVDCSVIRSLSASPEENFNTCIARYEGKGTIAASNFQAPLWTQLQLIVFNNNSFGVLWKEFYTLFVFARRADIQF